MSECSAVSGTSDVNTYRSRFHVVNRIGYVRGGNNIVFVHVDRLTKCPAYAQYFQRTWLNHYKPITWAQYGLPKHVPSGDNQLESYHSRLQKVVQPRAKERIDFAVEMLFDEAKYHDSIVRAYVRVCACIVIECVSVCTQAGTEWLWRERKHTSMTVVQHHYGTIGFCRLFIIIVIVSCSCSIERRCY